MVNPGGPLAENVANEARGREHFAGIVQEDHHDVAPRSHEARNGAFDIVSHGSRLEVATQDVVATNKHRRKLRTKAQSDRGLLGGDVTGTSTEFRRIHEAVGSQGPRKVGRPA
jgi:hypothetical protein